MTTPIDLEDLRKNPQDYSIDGFPITLIETRAHWRGGGGWYESAPLQQILDGGRITRKTKTRKIKVRPYLDTSDSVGFWNDEYGETQQHAEKHPFFKCWAGPEQEIEVTE